MLLHEKNSPRGSTFGWEKTEPAKGSSNVRTTKKKVEQLKRGGGSKLASHSSAPFGRGKKRVREN